MTYAQPTPSLCNVSTAHAQLPVKTCLAGTCLHPQLDYKYMFGIQVSNTKYPVQALRAMALQGKVMRLAIIGRTDVVSVGWDAGEQGRVYSHAGPG
jgi:hypothetical protein